MLQVTLLGGALELWVVWFWKSRLFASRVIFEWVFSLIICFYLVDYHLGTSYWSLLIYKNVKFLYGKLNFDWSHCVLLYLCRNFPSSLANLSKMDVVIKDGNAKITANLTLLNSVHFWVAIFYARTNLNLAFTKCW